MKHRRSINPFPRILSAMVAAVVFAFGFAVLTAGPAQAADAPAPVFSASCIDEEPSFQHGGSTEGFDYEQVQGTYEGERVLLVLVKDLVADDENVVNPDTKGFKTLAELKSKGKLDGTGVDELPDGSWDGGWFKVYPLLDGVECNPDAATTPDRSVDPERGALPNTGAADSTVHDAATGMAYGGIIVIAGLAIVAATSKPRGRHRRTAYSEPYRESASDTYERYSM